MIQDSFKNERPSLYLVATPIGNMSEMTPRAIEVLNQVDIIAAEDTRSFKNLAHHFKITTATVSYHLHNEEQSTKHILSLLASGKHVALVSDAGYPLISDPGQTLVFAVLKEGYNVIPISGSTAFLNALVASGLVAMPFAFLGFLEGKESQCRKQLLKYKDLPMTSIYYISVHKIEKLLEIVYDVLGDREVCLARELSKVHESFIRGSLSQLIEESVTLKGEFVLVIDQNREETIRDLEDCLHLVDEYVLKGESISRAISLVAKENKISKKALYQAYHENKKEF